jgi:hypothetical protein
MAKLKLLILGSPGKYIIGILCKICPLKARRYILRHSCNAKVRATPKLMFSLLVLLSLDWLIMALIPSIQTLNYFLPLTNILTT